MSIARGVFIVALGASVALAFVRRPGFETRERVRVQAHFDSVLAELRGRDVSALAPVLRGRRAALIETLQAYRDRGLFPHNYDVPVMAPTFVDPKTKIRCAVGQLIESTGRGEMVMRVAQTNNHVLVAQLAGDTAFTNWLDTVGITLAEAERIQPKYGPQWELPGTDEVNVNIPHPANGLAIGLSAGSLVLSGWNIIGDRHGNSHGVGVAGVVTGVVGLVAGDWMLVSDRASRGLATSTILTGVASFVTGGLRMGSPADARQIEVSPTVSAPDGKRRTQAGLVARVRF
jgi:hypothetical protein